MRRASERRLGLNEVNDHFICDNSNGLSNRQDKMIRKRNV